MVVTMSGCATEDAATVFDVLRRAFDSDRPAGDVPEEVSPTRPTVWVATVDVSEAKAAGAAARPACSRPATSVARASAVGSAARLSLPVTIDAQGSYWAVDRLRRHLKDTFAVRIVGTAAGDQEEEIRLRLDNR